MFGIVKFKKLLETLTNEKDYTAFFAGMGSKYTITANPDVITSLYANRDVTRSEAARRFVEHVGAVDGLVSQDDYKASIKRPILQKHFKTSKYFKHADKLVEQVALDIQSHKSGDINIHTVLFDNIGLFFIERLLGVNLTEYQKKHLLSLRLFHNDRSFDTPFVKTFFVNLFSFTPKPLKHLLDSDVIERHAKLDAAALYILEQCTHTSNGCLAELKQAADEGKLTHQDVIGECKMLLINASSLSVSIAWAVYCVAKHPEHIEKLLQSDNYSKLAFMEVLRLYPPFYILSYEQKSKCPFHFGSNKTLVSVSAAHRVPEYWANPEKFDPSRFSQGLAKIKKGSYIPFGGGMRACPGSGVAMMLGPLLLKSIFTSFKVVVNSEPVVKRRVELLPLHNKLDLSFFDLNNAQLVK